MMTDMNIAEELRGIVSDVLDDPQTLEAASQDASLFHITPEVVVAPKTVEEIRRLVRYASAKNDVSLTVRSGGTDMSGGALTESIVINVSKHINKLKHIRSGQATVQPGMFYRDFEVETLKHNLLLPSYPASRNLCTVGGMVANNSAGEKTLMYGKTAKFVKSLRVVLSDGNEYEIRPLSAKEAQAKMSETSFEGNLYRTLATIISENEDVIRQATPTVSKNSSGYDLWDVWDGETFDMTKLFVGSQGTLGIITEITFDLITPKKHSQMLVLSLKTLKDVPEIVARLLKFKPESMESYDRQTLKLALKYFPEMIKQMKSVQTLSLLTQLIPDIGLFIRGGIPHLMVLAEFTGDDEAEIKDRMKQAQAAVKDLVAASRVTTSAQDAEKYWVIRRESFNLLRNKMRGLQTAPFIDDFIVEPKFLPEFMPKLEAILSEYNIFFTIAGHVGEGNFHIIPLMDLSNPIQRAIIPELSKKVYDLVFAYGGSMSAEHNDGLIRSHYLPQMFGKNMYKLFEEVKHLFDPKNIFNPGKKVNSDWKYALAHIKKG